MLRYFLEAGPDKSTLFQDLQVWQSPDAMSHFQQYPMIYLSFKDIKTASWLETQQLLFPLLADELKRLLPALGLASLPEPEQQRWTALAWRQQQPTAGFLRELSAALYQATRKPVVILIDEYDAPLLTAWEHGYFEEAVAWFRAFLSAGLKDNACLFRGVLTGVLRVARESLFSGLNNVKVYSLLQLDVPEPFGFSETEVLALLEQFERSQQSLEFQRWYNGYVFGGATVYNPWSILNALMSPKAPLQPYWLNTAENSLIHKLLLGGVQFQQELKTLIEGGTIERHVDEHVVLRDLTSNNLWSFLLFSGYLKAEAVRWDEWGQCFATLKLPNQEVALIWRTTFQQWLSTGLGQLEPLHQALLTGDAPAVQELLTQLLLYHVSTWDLKKTQDEAFYHAFVLGLLVTLEKTHRVQSNREVGRGRADVQLAPKQIGLPGVILEFKKQVKGRTLAGMAEEALKQTATLNYTLELERLGVTPIYCFGIAFAGKKIEVRVA
jgi:hypothetical protein